MNTTTVGRTQDVEWLVAQPFASACQNSLEVLHKSHVARSPRHAILHLAVLTQNVTSSEAIIAALVKRDMLAVQTQFVGVTHQ